MIRMTGLPAGRYRGLRGEMVLNDLDVILKVTGRRQGGGQAIDCEFRFQADPVDIGASFLLALAGRNEASFTWMGMEQGDTPNPWVMRTYWFSRDASNAAVEFLKGLKENPEVDSSRLDSLVRRLERGRLFAMRIESLDESEEDSYTFPLSNPMLARSLSNVSERGPESTVRLIGGLRVMVTNGRVSVAAGNSGFLELTDEQRETLGGSLLRLLEADAVMGFRLGQISFFSPGESGESVWTRGVRLNVLGRTVPFMDVRDVARLAVLV